MTGADQNEIDVLVIGAGPVGLTMACELRRHGVSCRIVDQNNGPTPLNESRALGIQARTLEVFRNVGVIGPVLKEARRMRGISAYSKGRRFVHLLLNLEGTGTAYPYLLVLPQSRTERILLDRLADHGVAVERATALTELSQDGFGVTATLNGAGEVRASWVVGCDGSRSAVRKALGLGFEGGEYEERFLIADLHVGWSMPDDEVAIVFTPEGPMAAFPLPEPGRWRLVDTTSVVDSNDPDAIVGRFRDLANADAAPGSAVRVDDPVWTSSFHIHRRVVDRYREGRVFVAGDAAHLHSPAGGQGMNTGVQDAYNLAWKLALVVRGEARESLLDSYNAERRPVARAVLRGSDLLTRMAILRKKAPRRIGNRLLGVLSRLDPVRRRASLAVSELGVGYRRSPIVAEDRESLWNVLLPRAGAPGPRDELNFVRAPRPGDRAPDVSLDDQGGAGPSRLSDALAGTRHVLLLFTGAGARGERNDRLLAARDLVANRFPGLVEPRLVAHPSAVEPVAAFADGLIRDSNGAIHRQYGARFACLYLIRPDGYVGYRAQPPDAHKLGAYLAGLFDGHHVE